MTICPSYFRPDLYRFDVRLEVYDGPASSFVLLPCPRLTPRRHRQAYGQLSPLHPPLPSLTSFGAACVMPCGLPPPSLDRTTVAAVSSSLQHRKYIVGFVVNVNTKLNTIYFGHGGCVHREDRSLNTTIVEGPIERNKSRLASRETGDVLTGTHNGGSLDRSESVPKWSRKRRASAGLTEASQRGKDMRSTPPFRPDKDSFRFFTIMRLFVLSTIYSRSIV